MQYTDDIPVREALEVGRRWGERADTNAKVRAGEAVDAHVQQMHIPKRDMSPLTCLPFAGEKIPDPDMAHIVEMVSQGDTLASAALAFGHPLVLVERELARYYARHRRFCEEWALP